MSHNGLSMKGNQAYDNKMSASGFDEDDSSCCFKKCQKSCGGEKVACYTFKRRNDSIFCLVFAVTLFSLFAGVIFPLVIDSVIDTSVGPEVVIDSTEAPSYNIWRTNAEGEGTKVAVTFDIYFFNVQNPKEILSGAKPVVVELGPYAYKEFFHKFDIVWTDDGDTVTYNNQKYYIFDQERSGAGLTQYDNITIPYAAALGFQYFLATIPESISALVDLAVEVKIQSFYNSTYVKLEQLYQIVSKKPRVPNKEEILAEITAIEAGLQFVTNSLEAWVAVSSPTLLLFKLLLASTPGGVSPFWTTQPGTGYFGWLNDPLLLEVQALLDIAYIKGNLTEPIPWTSAVPGSSTNWTSVEETRRRRAPDTMKTGKKDKRQIGQFVRSQNMTVLWACNAPMDSQNPNEYEEGVQFPACAHFQYEWTDEEAKAHGYAQPFANDYANRIHGGNGEQFSRPQTDDSYALFTSDIYRSAFFIHTEDTTDFHNILLRRLQLNPKDMLNASANPENFQYYSFGPSGMLNLSLATNSPSFVSFPHFLNGDPRLIAAISGLSPDPDLHTTYLDVEPQTGELCRARKRLQTVWRMEKLVFPTAPASAVAETNIICANISRLVVQLVENNITNITIGCNLTLATYLLNELGQETDWLYKNDVIYFPQNWIAESNELSNADAEDLQSELFDTEEFASQFRYWCFIIGGGGTVIMLAMLLTVYHPDPTSPTSYKDGSIHGPKESLSPLLSANTAEATTPQRVL